LKYTREVLEPIVRESRSVAEVCRKLNAKPNGGMNSHLSMLIDKLGIDRSHFSLAISQRGMKRGGPERRPASEILVLRTGGNKEATHRVRRALLEIGRPEICAECGLGLVWNGKPLVLPIDHITATRWIINPRMYVSYALIVTHKQKPLARVTLNIEEVWRNGRRTGLRPGRCVSTHRGATPVVGTNQLAVGFRGRPVAWSSLTVTNRSYAGLAESADAPGREPGGRIQSAMGVQISRSAPSTLEIVVKAYGVRRRDRGCCRGHDKYLSDRYGYTRARARRRAQQPRKTSARQAGRKEYSGPFVKHTRFANYPCINRRLRTRNS
jgi:hypothetical protein